MEPSDVLNKILRDNGHANKADDLGSLATLFTEHWDRAEVLCNITLEDITRAKALGADMLEAISPSKKGVFDDVRTLRNRAAEYLREAIEEVRAAAAYIYRNNPSEMERYPSMFANRKKKTVNDKVLDKVNLDLTQEAQDSETFTPISPQFNLTPDEQNLSTSTQLG